MRVCRHIPDTEPRVRCSPVSCRACSMPRSPPLPPCVSVPPIVVSQRTPIGSVVLLFDAVGIDQRAVHPAKPLLQPCTIGSRSAVGNARGRTLLGSSRGCGIGGPVSSFFDLFFTLFGLFLFVTGCVAFFSPRTGRLSGAELESIGWRCRKVCGRTVSGWVMGNEAQRSFSLYERPSTAFIGMLRFRCFDHGRLCL